MSETKDDERVVDFPGFTKLDIPVDRVLKWAGEQGLTKVVVIGWQEDGTLYASGSTGSVGDNLHLVEAFKHCLLSGEYSS